MQKVISINLNGNAYQLDESAYERLREYLERAERALHDSPDRAEIMADLEQAIADKCQRYLGPHKTVVAASEVDRIVAEMGPVAPAKGDDTDQAGGSSDAGTAKDDSKEGTAPRRLYRILDGAMIAGVCNGLAVHLKIDVTVVRIAFVLVALLTKGVGIVLYIALMFVMPEAKTAEARAAAGAPLNAKQVIERAKRQAAAGTRQWRRHWRQQRRQWQRQGWAPGMPIAYGPPPWTAVFLPVFGLAHVALFLLMAAMLMSLVNTGSILHWELPPDVPVWAGVLILLVAYQIAVSPLRAFEHWTAVARSGVEPGWFAFWNAVTWLAALALVVWVASNHVPEIQDFLRRVPELIREFFLAIRDFLEGSREGSAR